MLTHNNHNVKAKTKTNKQTKIPGIYFNSRIKTLPRISRGFVWFSDIFKEDK